MGTLGLGQRALNLLRGGADLGAALGANLATSAMEHQHWGAASACVAGTALFIAGRNALSAHGEQKTHAQIEKRLLRALQDGQTDLLTAIKTVAAEQDAHAYISQQRVKRLLKLLSGRGKELNAAITATRQDLNAIGRQLEDRCKEHGETLASLTDALAQLAAQTHEDHQRLEQKVDVLVDRVTPPAIQPLHQLRPPLKDFTGRQPEIDDLLAHIQQGVTITGVQGMGGIGKTELAYVLADRVKDAYPDAQLCLELKGTSPSPLSPADVLAYIIHRFHPEAKLPDDVEELTKLYHSTLHGQRVLLLMDNAAGPDQLRPLCPPPDGSVLLVTSRQHFTLPGLHVKDLNTLPADKARELLRTICPRIADAADELARLCGCLPLALRLAGSTLACSTLSPSDYAQRLKDERQRLARLDQGAELAGEPEITASLALSDALLPDDLRPLWYALAVFPGDFDLAAAAAVCNMKPDGAQDALDTLHRYSVLDWNDQSRRFHLHDLVRLFVDQRLDDAHRTAAQHRHAEHFERVLRTARETYTLGGDNVVRSLALFDLEWPNIQAGFAWASALAERAEPAARLCSAYPDAGAVCLSLRQHPRNNIAWLEAALAASRRLKNRAAEGAHLGNLGLAYADLGDLRKAVAYHEQCLAIAREIADRRGEGIALASLGSAAAVFGDLRKAIALYGLSLAIARDITDRCSEANALGSLGNAYADLGQPLKAIEYHEQQLTITREIGDRRGESNALDNLGLGYIALDDLHKAIEYHTQSLAIAREIGDRHAERSALGNLGVAWHKLAQPREAIKYYRQALPIARESSDRSGEATILGNLGNAYKDLARPYEAIECYEQVSAIAREIGDRRSDANACWNMGLLHERAADLARAIDLMQVCVDYEREIGHPEAEQRAAHIAALRARLN